MKNAKNYFNLVANNYSSSSNKGIWNLIRNKEKEILLSLVNKKKYHSVLELGSGSGFYTNYLINYTDNKITCVDFSVEMLKNIKLKNVQKINEDIQLYKKNIQYDLIFCAGALEFVEDPEKIFRNAKKMLSPDGIFVILVPKKSFFGMFYKIFHIFNNLDVFLFSKDQIIDFSIKNRFKIKKAINVYPFSMCYCFENL